MPTQKPLRELVQDVLVHIRQHAEYLHYNNRLMLVFEGQLRQEIERSLKAELSETSYAKAIKRVPSINLLVRIVDKLSRVYSEPALRTATDKQDQDLIGYYEQTANINDKLTSANKMLNLHKCVALEPFVSDGKPSVRVIPAHQFLVFSDSPVDPLKPTVFIKMMGRELKYVPFTDNNGRKVREDETKEVDVYYLYSDTEFLIIDSDGTIRQDKMGAMGNASGENPIGVIPAVYVNRSDFRLVPCPDTDTLDNTVLIPKLLADLNYAVQFQSHSVVTAIDLDLPPTVTMSPDAVWAFTSNDEGKQGRIDTVKPSVDIEKVLMLIQSTLSMWLESRNIKAGALGEISAANAASGIAKIIDESDATQDRQGQCSKFAVAERNLWTLIAKMQAYWSSTAQVEERRIFSDNVTVNVQFPDQQPIQTEADRIEEAGKLLDAGLVNKRQAIKKIYPHLDDKTLDAWVTDLEGAPTFNGAQIEAMVNVLTQAAAGLIPRDSAKGILVEAFGLKPEKAESILGSIKEGGNVSQDAGAQATTGQGPQGDQGQGPATGARPTNSGSDQGADAVGAGSKEPG